MRKLIALLLAVLMVLALCACGKTDEPVKEPDAPQVENPTDNAPVDPQPSEDPSEEPSEDQPVEPQKSAFELAEECMDLPVEDLYALIGEPDSSDYAPSCLNPGVGEDGNLYYDGFVVYTYREGDTETVTYVEATE